MTPEQTAIFKAAIVEAVETHLASGNKLVSGSFVDSKNCRCPIGCLAYDVMIVNNLGRYSEAVSFKLGFDFVYSDLWAFADGFDGASDSTNGAIHPELFDFGTEMRAKYLKEENA